LNAATTMMNDDVAATTTTTTTTTTTPARHTLYDAPVSNNGARCRIILYKKGIPTSEVTIAAPTDIGGLKSSEYYAINPQQKMPALQCHHTSLCLGESDTICRYLLSTYATQGPSFQPDHPKSNFMARIHDMYLTPIQGCLYKASPPFGMFMTRPDAVREYVRQWHILEDLMEKDSTSSSSSSSSSSWYLCGNEVALADATIFPSAVFARHMLPKFSVVNPALPPKLEQWFQTVKTNDPAFAKVYDEIMTGLHAWESRGRWDSILGAGLRDTAPSTIFDKIVAKEIPATVVLEDDKIVAFKDINPAAPAHVLVIPKDRNGLTRLQQATDEHVEILGRLLVAAAQISKDTSLGFGDGARIVINDGKDGQQEVPHLHVHVLGGRSMTWPPG